MRTARAAGMLLLLGACTPPPDPREALAARILGGDLQGAVADLQAPDSATGWENLALRLQGVSEERLAVQAVERQMLRDAAQVALDEGRPADAFPAVRAGLRLQPDAPEQRALLQRLLEVTAQAPPEDALAVYEALLESRLPGLPDDLAARAEVTRLAQRYAPAQRDATLQGHQGATLTAAADLLKQLDQEYYIPPDWARMAAAGRQRLVRLLDWAPQPPAAAPLPDPAVHDLDSAVAALTALLAATDGCGLGRETRTAEWVEAALGSLDPWTRAVWPPEIASWQAHHDGVVYGAGLTLRDTDDGSVFVDRPLPGTAAWESGIHQADRVDQVGALRLETLPPARRLAAAEAALLGEEGSTVEVAVTRLDGGSLRFTLPRGPVKTETLEGYQRDGENHWQLWLGEDSEGLAYVRILGFRPYTEPDLDALLEPIAPQLRGLLLDLRSNPGGDLNASVQIADRFVEDGILAQLSGRAEPPTTPLIDPETGETLVPWNHAVRGHALEGIPTVILVDRDTASAAEVLSGVLQERAGAIVIGAPTWGKGYTQVLRTVEDPLYAVQFTNQIWTLPSGRHVIAGITPDILLELGPGEAFQANIMAHKRAALRAHADGTPMQWLDTSPRKDLPPLSEDPLLLTGELVLRALLYQRTPQP